MKLAQNWTDALLVSPGAPFFRLRDTFVSLPLRSIDKLSLGTKLCEIGRSEGATHPTPKAG